MGTRVNKGRAEYTARTGKKEDIDVRRDGQNRAILFMQIVHDHAGIELKDIVTCMKKRQPWAQWNYESAFRGLQSLRYFKFVCYKRYETETHKKGYTLSPRGQLALRYARELMAPELAPVFAQKEPGDTSQKGQAVALVNKIHRMFYAVSNLTIIEAEQLLINHKEKNQ